MSKTYQALTKVERLRGNGHLPSGPGGQVPAETVSSVGDVPGLPYDRLRVWMTNQSHNGSGVRVVMVAACCGGSGTTTTVAGLAIALSEQPDARVLMVDANVRTPGLQRLYGGDRACGLGERLTKLPGDVELLVHKTQLPNLFVLTVGTRSRSRTDIIEHSALDRLVTELRACFDFVVVDAPALLEFPEGYSIARHVDAVILVLDAERTSLDQARRTARELERAGGRPAGIVLNRQRDYTPRLLRRLLRTTA